MQKFEIRLVMLIQPHEFGHFGSRAGKNVFTIQDLNNTEAAQTSRTATPHRSNHTEISKPTSRPLPYTRISIIIATVLSILATLLSIALLMTGVGTSTSFILVAVLLTTLLAINLCHFVCLLQNSYQLARKN